MMAGGEEGSAVLETRDSEPIKADKTKTKFDVIIIGKQAPQDTLQGFIVLEQVTTL